MRLSVGCFEHFNPVLIVGAYDPHPPLAPRRCVPLGFVKFAIDLDVDYQEK